MVRPISTDSSSALAIVFGPKDDPLLELTLGELVDLQAARYGDRTATVFHWQRQRRSYQQLADRSKLLARSMLKAGLKHGDCIGIMAGNCYQYIKVFLGAARIGCPVVVLNNTYTPQELVNGAKASNCVLLFLAPNIGPKDQVAHIRLICSRVGPSPMVPELNRLVLLTDTPFAIDTRLEVVTYNTFVSVGAFTDTSDLKYAEVKVKPSDILNLQFTSGTTGAPKASMLTHRNLINNGHLVGLRMQFGPDDIVCCPPPLFHCFGLVMGFLGSFTTGGTIVFPCDQFEAGEVLSALVEENCTTLYGVPTMFIAAVEAKKLKQHKIPALKKGLAGGAPVPLALLKLMEKEFGIAAMLAAYGMTETSPVTTMTTFDDTLSKRLSTSGRVLPHTGAKIIDRNGKTVLRNTRGEICTSGFALQKGYWKNAAGTQEVMKTDENGVLWMHTGDEGILDDDGFLAITGRIKDLIIRGGENIFPTEIENRLLEHPAVADASVVGLPDEKYGQVVACFLRQAEGTTRPGVKDLVEWVRHTLGRHKAPRHVFWIGDKQVGADFPKTGSGKHQKHILRALGERLMVHTGVPRPKL